MNDEDKVKTMIVKLKKEYQLTEWESQALLGMFEDDYNDWLNSIAPFFSEIP